MAARVARAPIALTANRASAAIEERPTSLGSLANARSVASEALGVWEQCMRGGYSTEVGMASRAAADEGGNTWYYMIVLQYYLTIFY